MGCNFAPAIGSLVWRSLRRVGKNGSGNRCQCLTAVLAIAANIWATHVDSCASELSHSAKAQNFLASYS